jgi:predicted Fe-Mo cluster-binding NifX family protein
LIVAIPRFGEVVAPCFGSSATISIFTLAGRTVVEERSFCLQSRDALDRLRLLRDQGVELLICGGVQEFLQDALEEGGITVISWVSGSVDSLLKSFMAGELVPKTGAPGASRCLAQESREHRNT